MSLWTPLKRLILPGERGQCATCGKSLREDWRDERDWQRVWRDRPGMLGLCTCSTLCCGFANTQVLHWSISSTCADLNGATGTATGVKSGATWNFLANFAGNSGLWAWQIQLICNNSVFSTCGIGDVSGCSCVNVSCTTTSRCSPFQVQCSCTISCPHPGTCNPGVCNGTTFTLTWTL